MGKIVLRATGFALLALVVIALLSALALLALVGLPDAGEGVGAFQQRAVALALPVDLVVGGLVMLGCGWLAGRPFAGRTAIIAGGATGILYLALDLLVIAVVGQAATLRLGAVLLGYSVKLGAALVGGALAARRSAAADT